MQAQHIHYSDLAALTNNEPVLDVFCEKLHCVRKFNWVVRMQISSQWAFI